jgi:hypothetical protein
MLEENERMNLVPIEKHTPTREQSDFRAGGGDQLENPRLVCTQGTDQY